MRFKLVQDRAVIGEYEVQTGEHRVDISLIESHLIKKAIGPDGSSVQGIDLSFFENIYVCVILL